MRLPRVYLSIKKDNSKVDEITNIAININHQGYFPFSTIITTVEIINNYDNSCHTITYRNSIFHGDNTSFINFSPLYCGLYEFKIKEVEFSTIGNILIRHIPGESKVTIPVLPKEINSNLNIEKLSLSKEEDIYSDPTAGMDVSEIKELREYREGDKLSMVHWKLSSKQDLIVKEYARQASVCLCIALDASYSSIEQYNNYYEYFYGLCKHLIEEEYFFDVVYFDKSKEEINKQRINNVYDFQILLQEIYFNILPISVSELNYYFEENRISNKCFYISCDDLSDIDYRTVEEYKRISLYSARF